MQLLPSLLPELQAVCATFPDPRARGEAATLRPPISVCRRLRCCSCRARRFWPTSARWRKATAAPIAGRCSASAEFPPTITSATFWTRRTRRSCSPVYGGVVERAADAASLRPAERKDPDRLGRNGVLLLAETRLPALPDAQARQRQDRELSFYAVGDGRDARSPQGRAVGAGIHRAPGRR